ncbi:hypothetical protein H4R24_003071 [Coemansia sp. RSA 988]|nr:hypothetical protein H4R24_003071 [Coemansia sp. RSA 988]
MAAKGATVVTKSKGAKGKAVKTKGGKSQDKRSKKAKKERNTPVVPVKKSEESEDEVQPDEDDVDFVHANVHSLSFLSTVNPESLVNTKKEPKKKKARITAESNKVVQPGELTESEDEESDFGLVPEESDSDLEVLSDQDEDSGSEIEASDLLENLELTDSEADSDDGESMTEEDDKDGIMSDKDYEFMNSKARKAHKRKAIFGGEMNYEHSTRQFEQTEKKPKLTNKLPIKTADGRLALLENSDEENEEISDSAHTDDESDDGNEQSAKDQQSDSKADSDSDENRTDSDHPVHARVNLEEQDDYVIEPDRNRMSRKQYIIAQQNRLAAIADVVMQDPDNGLRYLKTLNHISTDADPRVKRLGLLTQLAVFCDILPEYRIRELTEKEQHAKVTKDVRQQRMREEQLVHSYSNYLKQLFAASKQALKVFSKPTADIETGIVAARALGNLINVRPLFNFRKDILSALVDIYVQPSSRINFESFTPMAQTARLAVLRLFRDDTSGELSQIAVILAAKRIKRLSYRVDPSALRPWLHLRLREELRENPEDRKRKAEEQRQREQRRAQQKLIKRKKGGAAFNEAKRALHLSKKQAKMHKVQQDVDKSLVEAEAEVSRDEREKWYGETLKQVFITYFRILKQKDNIGGLLPAVLEGLAKYAHLISVEFFVDLFQLLKKIMRGQHGVGIGAEEAEDGDDLISSRVGLRTALLCILSALHILTGQGEALNLDIKEFFYQLYALLPPLAARPQIEATRVSAQSDGTRYIVYLMPAEVAASNAARAATATEAGHMDGAEQSEQLEEAAWEETMRSESDLLFECLQLMFLGRTKVSSLTRVAAFCKRIAECALSWPPKTAVRAIEFIHRLLIKYPALDRMLSSEEQAGSGLYLRDLDDPDMCNPFATCLFELHWLQIHYHSGVQAATARLLSYAKAEQKKHRL